ncbi:bifunctional phosphopantothenoylcysteine decarboxylase/phosphopantothenate--cysteine ligase CoaBC [Desertivibrio insolitus]|uniref:bifunctional phosphopantothenoylcysteine decarboxylase/phosphopantothenate--cysteine ligase CoaBC n=1 Tax=Herbiconiux sp. SYSU D00978 TaxID=2812562 RepID=UPI001A978235|nr:bifunctional phosphopantothenoylcysteine decarboxylase/phosphopantothenate--cysteine ligase CoaBC [Herbiconiux sp. SYSU D00978]
MRIVVGITGGIAAYKAVNVVRSLVLAGHDVHVVPTAGALRFVGKPTLEAISRNPVTADLYDGVAEVRHVALGQSADLVIVAPATANFLARLAAGIADDLLGTTILASEAPVVVAPAMHTEMWRNPATVANLATLRSRGILVVGPEKGRLTGQDLGEGRMSEPDDIVEAALGAVATRDLAGKRIVVTAGGTREPLDPVRFLGNRSSGKQGVALAEAAALRGADVVLVAAHLEVPPPAGVRVEKVSTALELDEAARRHAASADVVVMAAAVADYRPASVSESKIKKDATGEGLALELVRNPDILTALAAERRPGQVIIGFAAETSDGPDDLLRLGREKIARKGADYLVLNRVGWSEGFATDGNAVVIVDAAGDIVAEAAGTKLEVAHRILDLLR